MATISLPYKLQVFIPNDLRQNLKALAHKQGISLQTLVNEVLTEAVANSNEEQERRRREAVSA